MFDFYEKRLKVGALDWTELRVIQVETKFDALLLQVDKEFLNSIPVPHLEAYGNSDDEPEAAENEAPGEELQDPQGDDFNGDIVPWQEVAEFHSGEYAGQSLENALEACMEEMDAVATDEENDANPAPAEEETYIPSHDIVEMGPGDPISISVYFDEEGNLVAQYPEVEFADDCPDSSTVAGDSNFVLY